MAKSNLAGDFMVFGGFLFLMYMMYQKGLLEPLVKQLKDIGILPVTFPSKPGGSTTTPPPASPTTCPSGQTYDTVSKKCKPTTTTPPAEGEEEEGDNKEGDEGGGDKEEESTSDFARARRARLFWLERKYGFRVRIA